MGLSSLINAEPNGLEVAGHTWLRKDLFFVGSPGNPAWVMHPTNADGHFRLAPGWQWHKGIRLTLDGDAVFHQRVSIGDVTCPPGIACAGRLGINNLTLAVGGRIGARYGIHVVAPTAAWPDYVFEPDYQLMPLPEVARYVRRYKHLPDVPSAAQVKAEGLELASTQAVLLRKLEELTLYVIGLSDENEQLKARLSQLEQR